MTALEEMGKLRREAAAGYKKTTEQIAGGPDMLRRDNSQHPSFITRRFAGGSVKNLFFKNAAVVESMPPHSVIGIFSVKVIQRDPVVFSDRPGTTETKDSYRAALAFSTIIANAGISLTARSASVLRLRLISALLRPLIRAL